MATTTDFVASANTAIYGQNTTYTTARSTSTGENSSTTFQLGQTFGGGITYEVFRDFLNFDTSSIPDNMVVTDVKLRMVVTSGLYNSNFEIQIIEQVFNLSSYVRETIYDDCLAASSYYLWRNTSSGITNDTQYTGASMTNGYVNKSGITSYSIRSSRDKSGSPPTISLQYEYCNIYSRTIATTSYRPTLIVTYDLPSSLPVIWI